MKKPKKLTYAKAKREAWTWFSKYIRMKACFEGIGNESFGSCFTCGKRVSFKQGQAGHFIPGRHNSVLFDERNCHLQDYYCNVGLKGNPVEYYSRMLSDYGQEVIDELRKLDKQILEYKVVDLVKIKEKYEKLYQALIKI